MFDPSAPDTPQAPPTAASDPGGDVATIDVDARVGDAYPAFAPHQTNAEDAATIGGGDTEGSDRPPASSETLALSLVAAGGDEDEPMEMLTRFIGIDVDPILCLIPGATRKEYECIKADIALHGLREPVKRVRGRWVDGRLRLMACLALGISPNIIDLPNDTDIFAFVMSSNAHRRHLTKLHLAVIAVTTHEWATTGYNQHSGGCAAAALPATSQEVADKIGVSRRLIHDAKLVHKAGLAQEVLTKGLSWTKALAEANKRLRSQEDTEEQVVEPSQDGPVDQDKASASAATKRSRRAKLPEDVVELRRMVRERDDEIHELGAALERKEATTKRLQEECDQLRRDIAQLRSQTHLPVRETSEPWPAGGVPPGQSTGSGSRIYPRETSEQLDDVSLESLASVLSEVVGE